MNKLLTIVVLLLLFSCNKNIYGIYNTNYSKDKSAFFQIKLNPNNTVENREINTISIFSKGKWVKTKSNIICYLDSSNTGFPADTLTFKIHNKKLFPVKNGVVNRKFYLKKE
jgi:hypothetical protein